MARRKHTKNPQVTEKDVEDALRVLRADYYSDVRGMAKDLADRMKAGDIEDFNDALHEDVDGCQRVIYTQQAQIGLLCSDNEDAYAQEFGEVPVTDGAINWAAMMYSALQQDIIEDLDAHGVDVNDPESWPDIDLSDFD